VGYAQPDWSDAEWKQVADLSMKAAKRLDISGVVVLHSGIILQILEGASDRMTEFVTTSSEYCRYDQIRSLYLDEIRQRQFKTFQIVAADNDRGISPHQFVSDILGIRTLPDASKAQAWLKIIQKYLGSSV